MLILLKTVNCKKKNKPIETNYLKSLQHPQAELKQTLCSGIQHISMYTSCHADIGVSRDFSKSKAKLSLYTVQTCLPLTACSTLLSTKHSRDHGLPEENLYMPDVSAALPYQCAATFPCMLYVILNLHGL